MPTFEERLNALESVVERLERGELSLDESVTLFEQGMNLSIACKQELAQAEGRIQILLEAEDGTPHLANLNPEDDQDPDLEDEED